MIFRLYSVLLYVVSIFFFPYMAVKMAIKGRGRAGIGQRLGFFEDGFFGRGAEKSVWVHAVSVGETLAAVPIVRALKARNNNLQVYFSTVTETGNAVARENLGDMARVFYFPFDFPFAVNSVVERMRPGAFVLVETEIWPNVLRALNSRGTPSVMVNGRISPRSYRGYRRVRLLMKRVLPMIAQFNMQTAQDAERIKALGAPADRVSVVGNVKFDQACRTQRENGKAAVTKGSLGIPEGPIVVIAGSTHEAEEEEVLKSFRLMLGEFPDAFLILAPRHPERLPKVEALLAREGMAYTVRSMLSGAALKGPGVILVDTMGELAGLYRVGDINFVGGSWVPVGGHNVLEPAAFGKPVFFGPHMHNFSEIAALLKECGVGIEVKDGTELAKEAVRLIHEPERLKSLERLAKETLLKNRGALDRNVELIERLLYG